MNEREQVLSSILFPSLLFSCSDSYNIRFYCCSKDRTEEERHTQRDREGENFLIPTFESQRNGMRIPSKLTAHITGWWWWSPHPTPIAPLNPVNDTQAARVIVSRDQRSPPLPDPETKRDKILFQRKNSMNPSLLFICYFISIDYVIGWNLSLHLLQMLKLSLECNNDTWNDHGMKRAALVTTNVVCLRRRMGTDSNFLLSH